MQELSAFDGGSTGPGAVLTAGEAERLIESLRPMGVEDVGSQPWMEQRGWIEKLNLQVSSASLGRTESLFEMPAARQHSRGARGMQSDRVVLQGAALTCQFPVQAHFNAQTHSEEFVNEALASFDKVSVLVHELVVLDIWKEKVFPLLGAHQDTTGCSGSEPC